MRFFKIRQTLSKRYYWAEPKPFPASLQDFVSGHVKEAARFTFPITQGRCTGDILFNCVWSTRMVDALRSIEVTGLECYEVNVLLEGRRLDGYVGVRIVGRGGALDEERSGVRRTGNCITAYEGIYMREADWDGADVFLIPGIGISIFVTERAAAALRPLKLKGVEFVPNGECRMGRPNRQSRD